VGTFPGLPAQTVQSIKVGIEMHMKKITLLFVSLLSALTIGVTSATAQHLQPSGESVGLDTEGNAIYQVHANGIKIG
jgi:hypothetical protein